LHGSPARFTRRTDFLLFSFSPSTLLRSLHDQGLLTFDFQSDKWTWNLDAIRTVATQEDVADVLIAQMKTLSPESQSFLQFASVSGNVFTLGSLSTITQMDTTTLVRAAREIEQSGLTICIAHAHEFILLAERAHSEPDLSMAGPSTQLANVLASISFRFVHDRIQASAYRLIPLEKIAEVHFIIARQLLRTYDEEERREYSVEICVHLGSSYGPLVSNIGDEPDLPVGVALPRAITTAESDQRWEGLFAEGDMMEKVIELELAAAATSRQASAYDATIRFLTAAVILVQRKAALFPSSSPAKVLVASTVDPARLKELTTASGIPTVDETCWSGSYSICVRIFQELAAAYFLSSKFAACEACIQYLFAHTQTLAEKALSMELHLQALNRLLRMQDSLDAGCQYLKELGITMLPLSHAAVLDEWLYKDIDIHDASTFKNHPLFSQEEMSDSLVMAIMSALAPSLFFLNSPLFPNVALTMLEETRLRGVTPDSAFALSIWSMCLWGTRQNFVLGQIARMILERYGESGRSVATRTNAVVLGVILPCEWNTTAARVLRACCCSIAHSVWFVFLSSFAGTIPLRENIKLIDIAFDDGLQLGDYEWLSYVSLHVMEHPFLCNKPIHYILKRQKPFEVLLQKRGLLLSAIYGRYWIELSEVLAGVENVELSEAPPMEAVVPLLRLGRLVTRGISAFYRQETNEAIQLLTDAIAPLSAVPGMPCTSNSALYLALALLQDCPRAKLTFNIDSTDVELPAGYDGAHVVKNLAAADAQIERMKSWAAQSPSNYSCKLLLMRAERNRVAIFSHLGRHDLCMNTIKLVRGCNDSKMSHGHMVHADVSVVASGSPRFLSQYEAAVESARKNLFNLEAALALELLGVSLIAIACAAACFVGLVSLVHRVLLSLPLSLFQVFYKDCERVGLSEFYLRRAYSVYMKCDLVLRTRQMVLQYPQFDLATASKATVASVSASAVSRTDVSTADTGGGNAVSEQTRSPPQASRSLTTTSVPILSSSSAPSHVRQLSDRMNQIKLQPTMPGGAAREEGASPLGALDEQPSFDLPIGLSSQPKQNSSTPATPGMQNRESLQSSSFDTLSILKAVQTFATEKREHQKTVASSRRLLACFSGSFPSCLSVFIQIRPVCFAS
jgi:hypothetical protein